MSKELSGALAHLLEGRADLVETDGWASALISVEAQWIELQPAAARDQLVSRNALEVGGVHEELALGDADRQEIGDVVVGNGVAVSLPVYEAVDAAQAIGDAGRVVGVAW